MKDDKMRVWVNCNQQFFNQQLLMVDCRLLIADWRLIPIIFIPSSTHPHPLSSSILLHVHRAGATAHATTNHTPPPISGAMAMFSSASGTGRTMPTIVSNRPAAANPTQS